VDITADVPSGESSFVADPDPSLARTLAYGDYEGLLAVNVPGSAANVVVAGVDGVEVQGRDGPTQVVGATVVVRRGQTVSVTVSFELPGTVGTMLIVPSARVPAAEWQYGKDSWQDKDPHRSNW
jgi:FtsP/CotA-like multicopper oxidase with cupredoxin domain